MRCAREAGEPQQQISLTQHRACSDGACLLYLSFAIARKRVVFALRAEFLFLSFPKEKGTKKKGNLRACALNPPHCTDLICSIKNGMCSIAAITVRTIRSLPLGGKAWVRIKALCQHNAGKSNFCRHNTDSVKLNSDHPNSISRQYSP